MKILFLIRDLGAGGAERQLSVLANGLAGAGHSVAVAVFCSGGKFDASIDRSKVDFVDLRKAGAIPRPSFLLRLIRLIRRLRPDIVHTYARSANTWGSLAMLAAPGALVWGVRNTSFGDRELYSVLADYASLALRRRASLIVANSATAKKGLVQQGYPAEVIRSIPNGIDINQFRRAPQARQTLRASWGIDEKEALVGLIGSGRMEKDPVNFFRAARHAQQRDPRLRFACIGYLDEATGAQLRRVASEADLDPSAIVWGPSRGDLHEVYSALDVLCLSSKREGFPNVVGEAMACEVPCVVTDVGDAATIVGDLGWVAPPEQSEPLGGAIVEAARAGKSGGPALRRRIAENFSIERLVERTEQSLQELLPSPPVARGGANRDHAPAETVS